MARKTNSQRKQQQRRGPNAQKQSRAGGPAGADPRGLTSMRVNCPADPPPNAQELTVSHRVQFDVNASAGATVTLAQCLSLVPGGAGVWDKARLLRVAVWGPASLGSTVVLTMATVQGDLASWKDYGTQGAKRPGVAVVPDFLTRITWMLTAAAGVPSTTPLFTVAGGGTGTSQLTVQVTLQLRTLPAAQEPSVALLRNALADQRRGANYASATNIVGTYEDGSGMQREVKLVSG